jgi:hypothetical protein
MPFSRDTALRGRANQKGGLSINDAMASALPIISTFSCIKPRASVGIAGACGAGAWPALSPAHMLSSENHAAVCPGPGLDAVAVGDDPLPQAGSFRRPPSSTELALVVANGTESLAAPLGEPLGVVCWFALDMYPHRLQRLLFVMPGLEISSLVSLNPLCMAFPSVPLSDILLRLGI